MATPDEKQGGESHGVYGGSSRDDSQMQEEPAGTPGQDEDTWAEATETGGLAAS